MMAFIKRYGFLFVPVVYWLVYLVCRLTYNGMTEGYSPAFFQSIRQDGVFILCGLLAFYFCCLRIKVGDWEFSGILLLSIISFHLIALAIALLFCLWRGEFLWGVICIWQMGTSVLLLFFIPVLTCSCGD